MRSPGGNFLKNRASKLSQITKKNNKHHRHGLPREIVYGLEEK